MQLNIKELTIPKSVLTEANRNATQANRSAVQIYQIGI